MSTLPGSGQARTLKHLKNLADFLNVDVPGNAGHKAPFIAALREHVQSMSTFPSNLKTWSAANVKTLVSVLNLELPGKGTKEACIQALQEYAQRTAAARSPAEVAVAQVAERAAFFDDFRPEDIVPVDAAWEQLVGLLQNPKGLLLRAPPRAGKTFLGVAATHASTKPRVLTEQGWTVEYYNGITHFCNAHHHDVQAAATKSANNNVVFYIDEAQDGGRLDENVKDELVKFFFKDHRIGRAIFVSPMVNPLATDGITPMDLVENTMVYNRPAPVDQIQEWLVDRLKLQGVQDHDAVADLLLELTNGHIGLIQHFGIGIMRAKCKDLVAVKKHLAQQLANLFQFGQRARCFGVQNGHPTLRQAEMISILRCSGSMTTIDANGQSTAVDLDPNDQDHRYGFNKALYAPVPVSQTDIIAHLKNIASVQFVNAIQPEIYRAAFEHTSWKGFSFQSRWVTRFKTTDKPHDVVDLVLSWLSHISTATMLDVQSSRIDPQEKVLQRSLESFLTTVFRWEKDVDFWRDYEVSNYADGFGKLDFFIDTGTKMGVELLIRSSDRNKQNQVPKGLLLGDKSMAGYLTEHVARTDAYFAHYIGQSSYEQTALECSASGGYCTVLVATSGEADLDDEFDKFEEFIAFARAHLKEDRLHHVLVALAPPGWADFHLFHYSPHDETCRRHQIQRACLLLKIVNDEVVTARNYYPKPEEVYVQEMNSTYAAVGPPFPVRPSRDAIDSLAEAIVQRKSLTCDRSDVKIYRQNLEGGWDELLFEGVLYENTSQTPYGYVVPTTATK